MSAPPIIPQPASLRDLYTPTQETWSFVPSSSNSSQPSSWSSPNPPSKSHVFSLAPPPSLFPDLDTLGASEPSDARALITSVLATALMQYATTAIAMPFEVGKTLLQVQWIPREQTDDAEEDKPPETMREEEDVLSDASSSSYFHDPSNSQSQSQSFRPSSNRPPRITDEEGYLLRPTTSAFRPDYIIPPETEGGVWAMMKRITQSKQEGWPSLWKGQLTTTLFDAVSQYLQPALQALFQSILLPSSSPLSPAPLPIALASHILTGVILSPLDLLRTHLIVQSASSHRIYSSNPLSSLPLLIHQKGGLRSTCFHPSLLIPTILDSAVRPYMTLSTPGFIYNSIGVTEDTYPITYAFAELLCSSASLLITIPIETVRRRLQIQSIPGAQDASSKSFHPCVEIRPQPYVGVVDCVWNILSEERGTPLKSSRRRRREHKEEGWFTSTGIPQLYRGFRLGVSANFFAFSLGILANAAQQANVDRWAEI